MPRWTDQDDEDWDDDVDEPDEEEEDVIPCPYCGREIHDESVRCPHCERYISREDAPYRPKPWWILLGVAACLYAVYRWNFG